MSGIRLADGHAVGVVEMDVERLVTWALRDQGLGWDNGGGSATLLGKFSELGTMVSGGMVADPSISLLDDTDAIVVRQAIDGLVVDGRGDREGRALVLTHGRAGTRPDWHPEGEGEPEPLVMGDGRARQKLDMLAWSKRCEDVAHGRGQWTAWRFALLRIGAVVNGRMQSHRATGPAVLAEPWLDAETVRAARAEIARIEAGGLGVPRAGGAAADPALAGYTIAELRAEAQAPVRSVATDWSAPAVIVREERRRRPRRESADDAGGGP